MTPLAFVDTETTGLDPRFHEVWEVALILRGSDGEETETTWQLPVNLGRAESIALDIGRFYERRAAVADQTAPETFARDFAKLTAGAHLVGAVPSFDVGFLGRLLRQNRACPGWHYHLIDVEALAVGYLASRGYEQMIVPPWKSDELTAALGIVVADMDKHTALGDARWAKAIYDAVMAA